MDYIPYGKHFIDDEDIKSVVEVLKSDWITQGPKIEEFEKKVADYHGSKFAVSFSNGTAALHGSYFAAGLSKGDEFITSPITFVATANAGLYCGGIPKFVDIDLKTFCIDIDKITSKITDNTKVITAVSYAGYPIDLEKIKKIAAKFNLKIIHDAAHAIGAIRDGKSICEFADLTVLSFHPVKHVATGEGGMVLTNDEKMYNRLKLFRSHGISKDLSLVGKKEGDWYYEMVELGYNYRITDIQCALGLSQMNKLDKSIFKRNEIAKKYEEKFKYGNDFQTAPGFSKKWTRDEDYKDLNKKPNDLHSYHLFPVLLNSGIDRKDFYDYMKSKNIGVQVHYSPVHLMPYYKNRFGYKKGDFPVAEYFYSKEISLPMYPTLKDEEVEYVIQCIKDYKLIK